MKPTVVSLFAGCGGSSLGYRMAGFEERLAVEWDADACNTFRNNFPGVPVHEGDIAELTADKLLELARVKRGELTLLDGSPPCQGFSVAKGKRDTRDSRNSLFQEYVRVLNVLHPKVFVMENVAAMVYSSAREFFDAAMDEFAAAGYEVAVAILDAKAYGVPQTRNRVIFIGARNDLGLVPTHPMPTVRRAVTVREAWKGLEQTEEERWAVPIRKSSLTMHYLTPQGGRVTKYHPRQAGYNGYRLHPNKPSACITAMGGNYPTLYGLMHPTERRRPSIPELKRLASFPDDFEFPADPGAAWKQIGNCVPPLMVKAIADHIKRTLLKS